MEDNIIADEYGRVPLQPEQDGFGMYALCLDEETKRIRYATFDKYALPDWPRTTFLPEQPITDFFYIDGEYIYDPLPQPEEELNNEEKIAKLEEEIQSIKLENSQILAMLDYITRKIDHKDEEDVL